MTSDHTVSFNSQSLIEKINDYEMGKMINFPSTKIKSEILKKKLLVMKNSDIEIGLITHCKDGILSASFYVTPLIDLWNIKLNVKNTEWLKH